MLKRRCHLRVGSMVAMLAAALLAGCVTEPQSTSRDRLFGTDTIRRPDGVGDSTVVALDPDARIISTTSRLRTEVIPLGDIEYNLLTMPLVSPDGRWIASETGIEPSLETITADLASSVPSATTITVYAVDQSPHATGDDGSRITIQRRLPGGVLLGRSCNDAGFLVESPQPDGTRWLGFADWEGGEIAWIARDEFVNAFGAIGPPGYLAWSRRLPESPNFELVLMQGGETITYGRELTSWIYPSFTSDGSGVFAIMIDREGAMTAQFIRGTSRIVMDQSRREIVLSKEGSLEQAWRMMAAYPAKSELRMPMQPAFIFDHPALRGVGVWRPLLAGPGAATLLEYGSTAGTIDHREFIVYSRGGELIAQPLDNPDARVVIAKGAFLPRRTASEHWRYLLFLPRRDMPGFMQVTGLNLIGLD